MLIFKKINEVKFYITLGDPGDIDELQQLFFAFRLKHPEHKFMPAYKNGNWDGNVKFITYIDRFMDSALAPIGLFHEMYNFMKLSEIEFKVIDNDFGIQHINLDGFDDWLDVFESNRDKKISEREYQYDAVKKAIKRNRCVLESPTGSGKSLILYTYMSWILTHEFEEGEKFLLVVPGIDLVDQMANDLVDYGFNDDYISRIHGGTVKNFDNPIIISTWQSLYKRDIEFFEQFSGLVFDEAHRSKSKNMIYISDNCINARFRLATSGTIQKERFDRMTIISNFGPVFGTTTTKDLISKGFLCDFYIKNIIVDWKKITNERQKSFDVDGFQEEYQLIIDTPERKDLVVDIINNIYSEMNNNKDIPETLLVLSNRVEYIEQLYSELESSIGSSVFFIHGGVKSEIRSKILKYIKNRGGLLVANISIIGTGINIPNISKIVFATTQKSEILTLQSIGRSIRLSKGKNKAIIYDITDNMKIKNGSSVIYSWLDYKKNIYSTNGFKYDDVHIDLNVDYNIS